VATTPDEARVVAERIGGVTVVKAQVKTGAGARRARQGREDAHEAAQLAGQILGMDIKGHTVHRVLVDPGRRSRRSTTSPSCSTGQPHVPRHGVL